MKQLSIRPAKRAVLYLRTSTVGGDDSLVDAELERQRLACQQVAKRHSAHIVNEYTAIGHARTDYVRHIVSIMLNEIAKGGVDYVITTAIDRLCCGPPEYDLALLSALRRSGARLLCGSAWDVPRQRQHIDDMITAARSCDRSVRGDGY